MMMARTGQGWIVGDVHGCARTFQALLVRLELDSSRDQLVLAGDLVNRGPRSLEALRLAIALHREMGERFEMVLGNHDLHLIAVALGAAQLRRGDELGGVLEAPDRDDLVEWLRRRPLLASIGGRLVVHAGLDPRWDWDTAAELAHQLEQELRTERARVLLERRRARSPDQEHLAIFTRLRTWRLGADAPDDEFSGPPEEAPAGSVPWYAVPTERPPRPLAFGHWAAHGRRILDHGRVLALDSGCAWGGELSAARVDDLHIVAEPLRD
jgi:bis(5'-nucleosyl)-tetraphosphatase (symmetrical)